MAVLVTPMGGFGQNNRSERPFERRNRRYGDNIKIDIKEISREGGDVFIQLSNKINNYIPKENDVPEWRALKNTLMNLRVPQQA